MNARVTVLIHIHMNMLLPLPIWLAVAARWMHILSLLCDQCDRGRKEKVSAMTASFPWLSHTHSSSLAS